MITLGNFLENIIARYVIFQNRPYTRLMHCLVEAASNSSNFHSDMPNSFMLIPTYYVYTKIFMFNSIRGGTG